MRHDAVVWGLARGASNLGVHIHQGTELTGINMQKGKIASVKTDKGTISTPLALNAAGGYSTLISAMVGIQLPIHVLTIQAMVTQPLKPILHHVVSSGGGLLGAHHDRKPTAGVHAIIGDARDATA